MPIALILAGVGAKVVLATLFISSSFIRMFFTYYLNSRLKTDMTP